MMVTSRNPAARQSPSRAFALGIHQFDGSLLSSRPGMNSQTGLFSNLGISMAFVWITARPPGAVTSKQAPHCPQRLLHVVEHSEEQNDIKLSQRGLIHRHVVSHHRLDFAAED